ncbi:hypothetical protein MPHLEI_05022 [Mycolicibacterium phlei RIVM601174]|nr:hypothetical protein MPHLEI_05022 [Mycolicibacterium phlei RIVM601174]
MTVSARSGAVRVAGVRIGQKTRIANTVLTISAAMTGRKHFRASVSTGTRAKPATATSEDQGFQDLSGVADGASATIRDLLGDAALPARSAIGVLALPSGAPVEVELTAAVLD